MTPNFSSSSLLWFPFLSALCVYLVEKSPIKYSLNRNERHFILSLLMEAPEASEKRFSHLLEALFTSQQMPEKTWVHKFLQGVVTTHEEEFWGFDMAVKDHHHLDAFYLNYLEERSSFSNFVEAWKMILTLSHRQASVEYSFSVDKSLLIKSLQKESLVSQHIVYVHMNVNGVKIQGNNCFTSITSCVKSSR